MCDVFIVYFHADSLDFRSVKFLSCLQPSVAALLYTFIGEGGDVYHVERGTG